MEINKQKGNIIFEGLTFTADDLRDIANALDNSNTTEEFKTLEKYIERLGLK